MGKELEIHKRESLLREKERDGDKGRCERGDLHIGTSEAIGNFERLKASSKGKNKRVHQIHRIRYTGTTKDIKAKQ